MQQKSVLFFTARRFEKIETFNNAKNLNNLLLEAVFSCATFQLASIVIIKKIWGKHSNDIDLRYFRLLKTSVVCSTKHGTSYTKAHGDFIRHEQIQPIR